jgi:hypothetical protein
MCRVMSSLTTGAGAPNVIPPSVEFETDTPFVPATHTPSNGSSVVQFVQIDEKKKFVALLHAAIGSPSNMA